MKFKSQFRYSRFAIFLHPELGTGNRTPHGSRPVKVYFLCRYMQQQKHGRVAFATPVPGHCGMNEKKVRLVGELNPNARLSLIPLKSFLLVIRPSLSHTT